MNNGYNIRCWLCGADYRLQMVAHRNKDRQMIGWLFVCQNCFKKTKGRTITLTTEEPKP